MLEITNHSSETNFIINKDGSHKVYPRLQLTTEMVNVFFSKTKMDMETFPKKHSDISLIPLEDLKHVHSLIKQLFSEKEIQNLPLVGRLKHFLLSWKKLTSHLKIQKIVKRY